jgi:hypothetical protein
MKNGDLILGMYGGCSPSNDTNRRVCSAEVELLFRMVVKNKPADVEKLLDCYQGGEDGFLHETISSCQESNSTTETSS